MAPRKLLLDATSKVKSGYGDWTKGYRASENIIDTRSEDGFARARRGMYGSPDKVPSDPRSKGTDVTPDDFQPQDYGSQVSQTTPSQTRKVSPEEAIDATFNKRK